MESLAFGIHKHFDSRAPLISEPVVLLITEEHFMNAMGEGFKVSRACGAMGFTPYELGGDPISHGLGKLAEKMVKEYFEGLGYQVIANCFKDDYKQIPESHDLQIGHLKADVKCANGAYKNGRLPAHYDALCPAVQARKSQADIFIWIFLDRLLTQGIIYGWAWKEEVLQASLRKDLKLPAYAVKVEDLHPLSELEALLR